MNITDTIEVVPSERAKNGFVIRRKSLFRGVWGGAWCYWNADRQWSLKHDYYEPPCIIYESEAAAVADYLASILIGEIWW